MIANHGNGDPTLASCAKLAQATTGKSCKTRGGRGEGGSVCMKNGRGKQGFFVCVYVEERERERDGGGGGKPFSHPFPS